MSTPNKDTTTKSDELSDLVFANLMPKEDSELLKDPENKNSDDTLPGDDEDPTDYYARIEKKRKDDEDHFSSTPQSVSDLINAIDSGADLDERFKRKDDTTDTTDTTTTDTTDTTDTTTDKVETDVEEVKPTFKKKRKADLDPDSIKETVSTITREIVEGVLKSQNKLQDKTEEVKPTTAPVDELAGLELNEDELDELEIAKFADTHLPEHKGAKDEYLKYVKARKEFIKAKLKEIGDDGDIDDVLSSKDFKNFMATQKFGNAKIFTKLNEKRIAHEAVQEARKEFEEKFNRQEKEVNAIKLRPVVAQTVNRFRNTVATTAIPEELREEYRTAKDGWSPETAFEGAIVDNVVVKNIKLAETLVALDNGLEDYSPSNPLHKEISNFITRGEDFLEKQLANKNYKDGKKFIARAKFLQLPPEKKALYATADTETYLTWLAAATKAEIKQRIKSELELYEKRGFSRKPKAATTTVSSIDNRTPTAKVTTSRSSSGVITSDKSKKEDDSYWLNGI